MVREGPDHLRIPAKLNSRLAFVNQTAVQMKKGASVEAPF